MATTHSHAGHPDEHHRNIQGGAARASVFGISDGLLTNVSLILGVAGAQTSTAFVRLAGLAGMVAGAFSMAAGEYVSVSAHSELVQRELEVERKAHAYSPEAEIRELAAVYRQRGLSADEATSVATTIMQDPEVALEVHAREELGVDPNETGSPMVAAGSSFVSFTVGALIPLLPWFVTEGKTAVTLSIVLGIVMAAGIGWILGGFTGRSRIRTALRQLGIAAVAAAVTYFVGSLVGVKV